MSAICGNPYPPPAITDMIQHVTRPIQRSQLGECLRFYGLLGYQQIPVPPGIQGRAIWLGRPETAPIAADLHLQFADAPVAEQGHVAFIVERYEDTVASLREAGHEVEPRREHWGSPRAYVRDPAGNLVELMARAPGERTE
jgi:catechol 2,3-dioxygenase-like lactoylglutathione lyase family enzyme